jgi:hypothetical protein
VNPFWQFGDEEEAEEEKRKRERNYQKLENFRINQLAGLKTRMKNRLDGIDDIYKKYLKAFETMDDSYRKRLDAIYNEKTSSQDKRKNFWESFGNISKAFLKAFAVAAAGAILLALLPAWAPLVMLGGVALVGAGCMVMAEVPKEYVPEWMSGIKDTSDGVSKKLKGYLKRPEGMIEDIGQGLMDTVQTPEGIASVSGTVSGMLLGNWAGKMIKPQVYAQVGKTKENVVKWWNNARNNVRTAGNGGRGFQVKPAPKVKDVAFSSEKASGAGTEFGRYSVETLNKDQTRIVVENLLENGELSLKDLQNMIPEGTPNTFNPTARIPEGAKYEFVLSDGQKATIRWHGPDSDAAIKYLNSVSGSRWTAQVKIGNKQIKVDGTWTKNQGLNEVHVPIKGK